MKVGVVLQLTDRTVRAWEIAPEIEQRGIESIWMGEHTHLPVESYREWSEGTFKDFPRDGELQIGEAPHYFKNRVDPLVTLAAVAAVTRELRLGTCISRAAEYNPIIMAKEIATLDQLSCGRFLFGVGYGWNRLELLNNGVDPDKRHAVLHEKLEAMRALWMNEIASFEGEFVSFSPSWSGPKPLQKPHPPIILGAGVKQRKVQAVPNYVDGWLAVSAQDDAHLRPQLASLRARLDEAGRPTGSVPVSLVRAHPYDLCEDKRDVERFHETLPDDNRLEELRALEVDRLILTPPVFSMELALPCLDLAAEVATRAALL